MKDRNYYYRSIWKYKQRREVLRKKYGSIRDKRYAKEAANIRTKIGIYKLLIKRIDCRQKKLNDCISLVNDFFDVDIRKKKKDVLHSLARMCYYKYGMEVLKIEGSKLSLFIGRSKISAAKSRLRFTRSFKTSPQNKESYHKFINSLKA
jgi:hypothetical protein